MSLTQGIKDAIDGMNDIDQALVILYVLGSDNDQVAISLGTEIIEQRFPQVETPTNTQRAKAIKWECKTHLKEMYVPHKAKTASNTAYDTAYTDAQDDFTFTEVDPTT